MHGHSHTHAPRNPARYRGRLVLSVALNLGISIAELVGGLLSGSLALLSDALHNFGDTASLGISLVAGEVAARDPSHRKTFGYKRAEIIAAFVNLVTLIIIALWLMVEAVQRFLNPQEIQGALMLWVAAGGLVANLVTAGLLYRGSSENMNIRSAFLHILTDGISSLAVVGGGVLILFYDVYIVDPILTAAISLFILLQSGKLIRETVNILMEAAPAHLHVPEIAAEANAIDGVVDVHHVHVWQLDEHRAALEAHVVIRKRDLEQMEKIKRAVKQLLSDRFRISHSTLEFEFDPCKPGDDECYDEVPAGNAPAEGPGP